MQMLNIVMETYRFGNVAWEKQWKNDRQRSQSVRTGSREIFIGG